jgi:hypothetical protein
MKANIAIQMTQIYQYQPNTDRKGFSCTISQENITINK